MSFPVAQHTIFLTLAGSQAHGTARDGSDVDLRGVCVAPLPVRLSLFPTAQDEVELEGELAAALPRLRAHPTAARGLDVNVETVILDVAKFLTLCSAANPNALEILFADERDWVLETPTWRLVHDARRQFLTRKVQQTFLGYATAQLRKIRSHRAWLLEPPARKPTREDFGLPGTGGTLTGDDRNRIEQSIADKLRSYGIDDVEMPRHTRIAVQERLDAFVHDVVGAEDQVRAVATQALGLPAEVVAALNAEKRYRAALKHWDAYQTWQRERNPARADLERAHGYDTKHAMHLVRLMRMGLEVLRDGELRVRRDDAAELAAIRDGAMTFAEVERLAEDLRAEMERAAPGSGLPEDVDRSAVDGLLCRVLGV